MRRLLLLIGGTLAFWALVGLPLRLFLDLDQSNQYRAYLGASLLLCLVPAAATFLWSQRALSQSAPEQQMAAILGGTGVRMFITLGGAWVLTQVAPYFQDTSFWIWLAVAYMVTLALEITLLLAGRPASQSRPGAGEN